MKKNMIFSGAMSMMTTLLLCTACSSDDYATDKAAVAVPEGKVIHYTATVGEGDGTRATLNSSKKYEFQTGDKLVITGTNISGELTLKAGDEGKSSNATFSGNLTYTGEGTPADNLELKAVLVSSASESAGMTLTYDEATYPTTAIGSSLADAVEKYSHFTATSTYADKKFKVSQQTSFLNFTVTFTDGTAANTDFNITIKNVGLTVRTGSVKTAEVDSKVVAQFVAAMPKGTTMSSATVQLGTKSAIAFGGTTTLVANKIYNIKKTVAPSVPAGALSGKFSVSATKKVYFSKGNLQLSAANTWKFADNQWDYFGNSQYNNHRDLFGWGTGNNPNQTSEDNGDYSSFTDWGTAAASSIGSGWRTLTGGDCGEWEYLFGTNHTNKRNTTSGILYAKATVNGVSGVILLPDDWSTSYYTLNSTNSTEATYDTNTISESDWSSNFEAHGCVFLPAAGYREGTSVRFVGDYGGYWSSTAHSDDTNQAHDAYFESDNVGPAYTWDRYYGFSVRLVRDVE